MARLQISLVLCAGLIVLGAIAPASAQFGQIFAPPRPPADVPMRPQVQPPPNQQLPNQSSPRSPADGGQPGTVQSQPLPPPGGAVQSQQQQGAVPAQSPLPGLPAGQRQPRGAPPQQQPQQEIAAPPQTGDELTTELPSQKVPNSVAIFSGLDKITGRIITFDAAINETVQFGALQVTPRACYTRPVTESSNTDAFIEIDEITLQGEVRRLFGGWMFASSPGLHGVEHPIYDIWLVDCKKETPPATASAAAKPAPPSATPALSPTPTTPAAPTPPRR